MCSAVFAVILLLLETVCPVLDNICASAHPTVVGFLDHTAYLIITYFSSTTLNYKIPMLLAHTAYQRQQVGRLGRNTGQGGILCLQLL